MSRSLEFEADTPDAAVARALDVLEVGRDAVDVEILDDGRPGFMGMGSRLARVRVTVRGDTSTVDRYEASARTDPGERDDADAGEETVSKEADTHEADDERAPQPRRAAPPPAPRRRRLDGKDGFLVRGRRPRRVRQEDTPGPAVTHEAPHVVERQQERTRERTRERAHDRAGLRDREAPGRPARRERPTRRAPRDKREDMAAREERPAPPPPRREVDPDAPPREVSVEAFAQPPDKIVMQLLQFLGCTGSVEGEVNGEVYEMDVEADDTSLLIGKRGQNLESLQYIVNRICNFGLTEPTPIILDVAGYRERRAETLEDMAASLADKVARTRRPVSMQPLPPHERRIVHMALRDDEDVETFSRGQGEERYLVIAPRRNRR